MFWYENAKLHVMKGAGFAYLKYRSWRGLPAMLATIPHRVGSRKMHATPRHEPLSTWQEDASNLTLRIHPEEYSCMIKFPSSRILNS